MPDIAMTQTDLRGRDCNDHKMKLSDLKFESNNGAMEPSELAWLPRYDAKSSLEDIRRELETRGVVHIRGLIPRETVLGARRQLTARWFEHMAPCGLLKEGTDPVEGIYCGDPDTTRFPIPDHVVHFPGIPKDNMHLNLVEEATTSDWINAFADNKDLLEYVKQLKSDWADPFLFKRRLYRANLPFAKGTSTGVHYDQIFLRGGPPTTLTAWIPIGDCNPMQGGLMYLEDSMMIGEQQERAFDAMCGEKEMTDAQRTNAFNANMASAGMLSTDAGAFSRALGGGRKWLIGDFEAGDVVFHHSYMIHASGRNVDPEMRIRLSADLRFADREAPYDERWNQRWRIDDGL